MCILEWKRSRMEIDIIPIEKILWDMRRLIGAAGKLGVPSHIDTSQSDLSTIGIAEVAILDSET